jgi:hypothetical protein
LPCIEDDGIYLKHIRVYALADMLDVPQLKLLAARKLKLQPEIWQPEDFIDCVQETYTTTYNKDLEIRNILVDVAYDNRAELVKHEIFHQESETLGEFLMALVFKITTQESKVLQDLKAVTPVPRCWRCGYEEAVGCSSFSREWRCDHCR